MGIVEMLIKKALTSKLIVFDEEVVSQEYNTTTLYFIAPKQILTDRYPEANHTELSVEFPTKAPEPKFASVQISPTAVFDGVLTDYDWLDIDIEYEEIETLINLWAKNKAKS